jgi:hemolysin activation/secretion protein
VVEALSRASAVEVHGQGADAYDARGFDIVIALDVPGAWATTVASCARYLKLDGRLKVASMFKNIDDDLPGLKDIDITIAGEQAFDPFLVNDGENAKVEAAIPPTDLPEIPLGSTAWRLGAGISRVEYELGQDFAGAGAVGSANVADVSLSYPFIRTRDRNLVGRVALTSKKLVDEFGDTTEKKVRGGEFGLSFENRDAFAGGGFTGGNLSLQFGKLDIESEVYRNYDATLGDRATQGSFRKLGVQVNRLQAVVPRVSLFVGLVGQFASKNLDNAEKMTLGGARGVRAYPSAEGSSDEAAVLNTELRLWVDPQWTGFLFYDAGHGKRFKRPDDDGRPNTLNLHGSGLGVQYTNPEFFTLKAAVARRGDEPVTSEADDKRTRFLVELQHAF